MPAAASRWPSPLERDGVVVTIRDNGIGIPADRLDSVFEMFSQVETAIARSRGGLGIGLSLTQKLVQMHGGAVRAHSDGTSGTAASSRSCFPSVTRPKARCPTAVRAADAPELDVRCLRLLVVDDNVDAAETLAELLGTMGYQVRAGGRRRGRASPPARPSIRDVVLLDIGLPGMNGYDVCRQLRRQRGGKGRTMVAVTGWGQPEDLQRSKEAGFDRHLVKPMDFDALLEILKDLPTRPKPGRASRKAG
jgi:CheY-like chemotaxis protein